MINGFTKVAGMEKYLPKEAKYFETRIFCLVNCKSDPGHKLTIFIGSLKTIALSPDHAA